MKKARNILLILTIIGYSVLVQILFDAGSNSWMDAKRKHALETMNHMSGDSTQTDEIELEPIRIELNKGMDPTPIPKFPPKIANGALTEKWNEEQDGIFRAD